MGTSTITKNMFTALVATTDNIEWTTIGVSLRVAFFAMLWVMPVAFLLARYLSKVQNLWIRVLIESVAMLPLVLPPTAVGYGLLLIFGTSPMAFHFSGAVLAAAVVSFPLALRSIRISLESIDPHLEESAATLGASSWRILKGITLPLAWPGLLSAAILVFVRSLGEFGATMMFAGNLPGETRTLSVALWTFLKEPGGETKAIYLLIFSISFGFICMFLSEYSVRLFRRF